MPAGNFALYLYHDEPADMRAQEIIERTSQPLRGEFLRAAAASGAILFRIDMRLPSILTALLPGHIQPGQFSNLLALLRGEEGVSGIREAAVYPWRPGSLSDDPGRRRFSVKISAEEHVGEVLLQILDESSTRKRNSLLRELVIAGCALHELDVRFVKLLSSMPEPPATIAELQEITAKLAGKESAETKQEEPNIAPQEISDKAENPPEQTTIRKNMKRLF